MRWHTDSTYSNTHEDEDKRSDKATHWSPWNKYIDTSGISYEMREGDGKIERNNNKRLLDQPLA